MDNDKEKDVAWGKRLRFLRNSRGLSQKGLVAEEIDLSLPTVQRYESGELPSAKGINEIVKFFKCNKAWLLSGDGIPFPGRPGERPEVRSPHMPIGEQPAIYNKEGVAQKINIEEAIGKAYIVLRSGTPYAVALDLSITQIADALDMGVALKTWQDEIKDLRAQVNELRKKVEELTAVPASAASSGASSE